MAVGAEAAAITALAEWSRTQEGAISSAAMIQNFQGTEHELLLAVEQSEIMQWGETFDVVAEFQDVLIRLRNEQRKQQLQAFTCKNV